jgi:hypothetical protein
MTDDKANGGAPAGDPRQSGDEQPPPLPSDTFPPPPPPPAGNYPLVTTTTTRNGRPVQDPAVLVSAICLLIGSLVAFTMAVGHVGSGLACMTLCLAPTLSLVVAMVTLLAGIRCLQNDEVPPDYVPILMICNIIACDLINFALGIAILVICKGRREQ